MSGTCSTRGIKEKHVKYFAQENLREDTSRKTLV
jgi:hypothetical protein